jgi:hypothetical protein
MMVKIRYVSDTSRSFNFVPRGTRYTQRYQVPLWVGEFWRLEWMML